MCGHLLSRRYGGGVYDGKFGTVSVACAVGSV